MKTWQQMRWIGKIFCGCDGFELHRVTAVAYDDGAMENSLGFSAFGCYADLAFTTAA